MTEIANLENRITAAIERISRIVEGYQPGDGPSWEVIEQARASVETSQADLVEANERAATAAAEVQRLQEALDAETTASAQLRERANALKAIKESQQERISELEAELKALSETRSTDREELDGIIASLEPLVREQTNA